MARSSSVWRQYGLWIAALIVIDVIIGYWAWQKFWHKPSKPASAVAVAPSDVSVSLPPPKPQPLVFGYPSDQDHLSRDDLSVFMPTAAGTPESGTYGSVRTGHFMGGSGLASTFHEGLDIAPLRRDRAGRALDNIHAVADGVVAYINQIPGNSTYGKYIVVLHRDPLGDIYSLYAHMAEIASDLRIGDSVARGTSMGVMGNTSSSPMPLARSHLHFEIGLINNDNYGLWFRRQRLKPDHGNYNGQNLNGIQPLDVYAGLTSDGTFSMGDYLRHLPVTFELLFTCSHPLDYFRRYPDLWSGTPYDGQGMWVSVSESGVLLRGRNLNDEERQLLGGGSPVVRNVNRDVLGRNGRHLIVEHRGIWTLGPNGKTWMEILTY